MAINNSQLPVDDVFNALSRVQRRKLLESLIADSPPDDAVDSGIKVDYDTEMYHKHLPKLADCGLIHWDRETCRVTKGPNFEAAAEIIQFLDKSDLLSVEGTVV